MLISDDDYSRVQSSLCDMMYAICDHAHDRCVKVIVARSKVSIIYCMLSVSMYITDVSRSYGHGQNLVFLPVLGNIALVI